MRTSPLIFSRHDNAVCTAALRCVVLIDELQGAQSWRMKALVVHVVVRVFNTYEITQSHECSIHTFAFCGLRKDLKKKRRW